MSQFYSPEMLPHKTVDENKMRKHYGTFVSHYKMASFQAINEFIFTSARTHAQLMVKVLHEIALYFQIDENVVKFCNDKKIPVGALKVIYPDSQVAWHNVLI